MKFNIAVTPKELALPIEVIYDFHKTHWFFAVRLLWFLVQIVYISPTMRAADLADTCPVCGFPRSGNYCENCEG